MSQQLKDKKIVLFLLLVLSVLIMDVFYLTPVALPITFLTLLFSTAGHILFITNFKRTPFQLRLWYIIFLALMIMSVITANLHYGQSLFSGFVANVELYHIGSAFLFYILFKKYRIDFRSFFKYIIGTASLLLIFYLIMAIFGIEFVNVSERTGNVVVVDISKVSKTFVIFSAIYCFSRFLVRSEARYLFYALLFFSVIHWAEIQRFALLVTLLVIVTGSLVNRDKRTSMKLLLPTALVIVSLAGYLLILQLDSVIIERFAEAFKIFLTDTNPGEASTAVRIIEAQFAIEQILNHPLFGNGNIRASMKSLFAGDLYFYLSDIGILGVLYAFGVVGLIVYIAQATDLSRRLLNGYSNHYQLAIILNLLYLVAHSLLTGKSMFSAHLYFFFIVLSVCVSSKTRKAILKYEII